MPDLDIVHKGLPYNYQKVYKMICEDSGTAEELAYQALGGLRKELEKLGNEPLQLIKQFVQQIADLPTEPLFHHTIDWKKERLKIEKASKEVSLRSAASKRALALAEEACHKQLLNIQDGHRSSDLVHETIKSYITSVHEAQFEGRLSIVRHHNDAEPDYVNAVVSDMGLSMEAGFESFARQARNKDTFASLKRPPRPSKAIKPIDLYEDLLS